MKFWTPWKAIRNYLLVFQTSLVLLNTAWWIQSLQWLDPTSFSTSEKRRGCQKKAVLGTMRSCGMSAVIKREQAWVKNLAEYNLLALYSVRNIPEIYFQLLTLNWSICTIAIVFLSPQCISPALKHTYPYAVYEPGLSFSKFNCSAGGCHDCLSWKRKLINQWPQLILQKFCFFLKTERMRIITENVTPMMNKFYCPGHWLVLWGACIFFGGKVVERTSIIWIFSGKERGILSWKGLFLGHLRKQWSTFS